MGKAAEAVDDGLVRQRIALELAVAEPGNQPGRRREPQCYALALRRQVDTQQTALRDAHPTRVAGRAHLHVGLL